MQKRDPMTRDRAYRTRNVEGFRRETGTAIDRDTSSGCSWGRRDLMSCIQDGLSKQSQREETEAIRINDWRVTLEVYATHDAVHLSLDCDRDTF